ncbi:MAG TPA: hypothetical protein PLB62_01825 [Candidatus Sumerlaeota bacterium]|nr:hypothetical protein [Candidatus Sumerlaeota bacterium]
MPGRTIARAGHHFLTQSAVVAAMRFNITSIAHLSYLYGAALYYLPWLGYALSSWIFLRSGRPFHAFLIALMYSILVCFTGFFVISESHLAASLFVLTITILSVCDLTRIRVQCALLVLWVFTVLCYEFWAIFFIVSLVFLLSAVIRTARIKGATPPFLTVAILYLLGIIINAYMIFNAPYSGNRDAMFGEHFSWVKRHFFIISAIFTIIMVYASICLAIQSKSRIPGWLKNIPRKTNEAFRNPLTYIGHGLLIIWCLRKTRSYQMGEPSATYLLRSLNLALPLLFSVFLLVSSHRFFHSQVSVCSDYLLGSFFLVVLFVAIHAFLFHVFGWRDFHRRVYQATQNSSGYVEAGRALSGHQYYAWSWTYPTTSLLVQAMKSQNVKSVIYSPEQTMEPFGPQEIDRARKFMDKIGVSLDSGALTTENTKGAE